MPGSVSIGSLYGTLSMRDVSGEILASFKRHLKSAEQQVESLARAAKSESERVETSLRKLSASLDPVVAGQQKLDAAAKVLDASLKRGLITQNEYNQKLAAAKSRYVDNSAAAVRAARDIERAAQRTAREQERASLQAERARKREADQAAQAARQIQRENERLTASYNRVVAALDPAAGRAQKYKQTVEILTKALSAGKISQEDFNRQLGLAKNKYLEASDALDKLNTRAGQLSSIGTTLTAAVTVPIVAIAGGSIKAAKDFESSFAGVDKTVDGVTDSFGNLTAEGAKLQKGLRDLASGPNPIPIDINELNAIAESAGQLGIARDDILAFTRVMADLGQTTNLTSTDAADAIARFQNIFGAAGKEVDRFGSALVALGNKSASTERDILSMGVRIAAAGNQIGLSQGQVLAYAATLSSVGIEAEAGGSAISKVMIDIALAVATGGENLENFAKVAGLSIEEFSRLFREDAAGAIEKFISGLGKLDGETTLRVLDQMGISEVRMRNALLSAAGAGDLLRKSLDLQAQAWSENTALTAEAEKRYRTFESQLQIFWGRLQDIGITLGSAIIPLLNDTISSLQPVIETVKSLAEWFSGLDNTSKKIILTFGGLAASVGPVLFVSGQLIQAWTTLAAFSPKIAALAGPWGAIAIAIGTVTTATIILLDKWRQASEQSISLNRNLADLQGNALRFQQFMAQAGNAVAKSRVIQERENARQLAIELQNAKDRLENLNKSAKTWKFDVFVPPGLKARIEEEKKNVASLSEVYERQKKSLSSITAVYDDMQSEVAGLTGDIPGLVGVTGELDSATQKLVDTAKKSLEQSRLERENQLGLLAARRIGLDAVRLEESIQKALAKAREAGTAATSEQRLEIIKNSLAADQAENSFKRIEQAQKDWTKGIEDSNKELEKQLKILADLEEISLDFGQRIIGVNRNQVSTGGQQATDTTRERLETARQWRESWRTARDVAEEEIKRINDAIWRDTAERERALSEVRIGLVESYAEAWVSFFSFLGGMFDGLIAEIANGLSQLQAAYQQFSSLGKSMGMDASAASGLGYFGVFVAVVDIAHGLLEAHKQNQRNRQWMLSAQALGTRDRYGLGDFQIGAAQDAHLNVSKASRDASKAINDAMEEIATAIGGVLKTFEDITINIRRDGKYFQAVVGQQIIGIFESFEAAMEAALEASLLAADTIITGLSDLVQQGLAELRSGAIGKTSDLDQIVDFLSALKEISELGLPQGAVQMQELTRHFDELWRQLERMNEITPAVSEGFTNLLQAEISAWEEWSRNIRGVEQTQAELLAEKRREAELFNASKKLRIAELELKVLELKAQAEQTRATGRIIEGRIAIGWVEIESGVQFLKAKGELVKAEASITEQYIAFINAVIEAINDVIEALKAIPEIDPSKIKLPRVGGAGAGGRDSLSDMIADSRRQISQAGLPEWQRQIADVNQRWDEAIKGLGNLSEAEARARRQRDEAIKSAKGNEEATRKANEAYERQIRNINATREEIEAANRQREAEIRLIEEQARKDITANFREFLGLVTPFDQVRQTATELIKQIESGPFGNARKAAMVARVLAEVDEQITKLSMQETGSLLGDLANSLEKFGIDSQLQHQMRMNAAVIEHQFNLINYRERIELLKAEGKIAPQIIADMERALHDLEGVDVRAALADDGRRFRGYENEADRLESTTERVNSELNRLADSFAKAKDNIRSTLDDIARGELGIVAPEQAFEAARQQYEGMLASARAGELIGFEEASNTSRNFIEALKRFSPQLAATELPRIQQDLSSLLNAQTVRDENVVYSERFAANQEAGNKTLTTGFTDLSNRSQEQSIIQARMLEQIRQLNESNAELNSKLARLEASQQANKRTA